MIKTRRKTIIIFFIIIAAVCVLLFRKAVHGFWYNDYRYYFDYAKKELVVEEYRGMDEEVVIPTRLGLLKVNPELGLYDRNNTIKKVFIPKEIPRSSFVNCDNLEEVEFEQGTEIVSIDIRLCPHVKKVIIPDSVRKMTPYCFAWCEELEDVHLPSKIEFIGTNSFDGTQFDKNHKSDKYYVVGDGVLLFYNGDEESVVIPEGIKQCPNLGLSNTEKVYYAESIVNVALILSENATAYFGDEEIVFEKYQDGSWRAGTFVAPKGSYVEQFCKENNIKFRVMTDEEEAEWREKTKAAASEITYQDNN